MEEIELSEVKKQLELDFTIYEFKIGGFEFLYRPLTIKELSLPSEKNISSVELEDYYLRSATLYPAVFNWDKMKAGHVSQYVDEILRESGFDNLGAINKMLERHRQAAETNIITSIKSYIITAMPAYKESDLLDISMDELVRLVVMAEEIITLQQQINGIDTTGFKLVISPVNGQEEPEAKPAPKKQKPKAAQPEQALTDEQRDEMRKAHIRRIKSNNASIKDTTSDVRDFDTSWLEDLDEDALRTISGVTKQNDPIADKLNRGF